MIITITCNPAIDKTVYDNKIVFDIGGKGINVSRTLMALGSSSIATGLIGRNNKNIIIDKLNELDIDNHFIEIDGCVRTNTKIIANGILIEENENGPSIKDSDIDKLFYYLNSYHNEIVVISGSISNNVDPKIYGELIKLLKDNSNYVIVDCAGDLLKYAIEAKPNIIKPNKKEICDYFNIDFDEKDIIEKCRGLGIDLICVSLDSQGALFIGDDVYKADAIDIDCVNSVGAGDAMVAAMAYSIENNYPIEDMIKLSIACSAAHCTTINTSPADYFYTKQLINRVGIVEYTI